MRVTWPRCLWFRSMQGFAKDASFINPVLCLFVSKQKEVPALPMLALISSSTDVKAMNKEPQKTETVHRIQWGLFLLFHHAGCCCDTLIKNEKCFTCSTAAPITYRDIALCASNVTSVKSSSLIRGWLYFGLRFKSLKVKPWPISCPVKTDISRWRLAGVLHKNGKADTEYSWSYDCLI